MSPRQIAGRSFYLLFHAPAGAMRRFFADGGPFEQHRTEMGRRAMEAAAFDLPPPSVDAKAEPLPVHLLTGTRFWYQTVFCLHSFSTQAGRPLAPAIYDDGSLTPKQGEVLARLFPLTRFISRKETVAKLDRLLPRTHFPFLRERWDNYPNLRKLIDPHLDSTGWKLVLDSDLLFFHRPDLLTTWLDLPTTPLHAIDVQRSYGYTDALLASLVPHPLADRVNVGLCGLCSEALDWSHLELLSRTLIERERTSYYLEQALVALFLAGRPCVAAPYAEYTTLPNEEEACARRAVMHHYVAGSKRWYFQQNWRHCLPVANA